MNATRKHLIFLILITLTIIRIPKPSHSYPRNTTFEFQSLPPENLTFLGAAHFRHGVAALTNESETPSSSSGTIIYTIPIRFSDNRTNSTTSFSTNFTFSIFTINPLSTSGSGGLSFFISPENNTLGSPGSYLGLVNVSQLTQNKFIAIEFDTRVDLHFNDSNGNHVGLDIDSLNSIESADCMLAGIDLKTGGSFTSWIDYIHDIKSLKVFLTRSGFLKPDNPILVVEIDFSKYFTEYMYVGFSGSTENSTDSYLIESWSFKSFGMKRYNPRADNPLNVSSQMVPFRARARAQGYFSDNKYHRKLGFGLEVTGPMFVLAGLVLFGYISVKKWREVKNEVIIKAEFQRRPRQFSYKELRIATNDFHSTRVIGHGAFGTVYKAFLLPSGTMAAVKRSLRSTEAKNEFLAELSVIAGLRHKNLVQLLGWCFEKGELLLVYELMPYGSIDKVLYQDPDLAGFLKWNHRYKIAIGLASVLAYLHQECDKLVIHRDIKSSNVMLDVHFNARLGDFGLARLIDHNKSPISTLTAGTAGYLAPEYLHCGKANDKTDVYSYGVLVLEVCCGRRPIDKEPGCQNMLNLVDWVWGLYANDEILDAIDERLNGEFVEDEAKRLLMVGLSCVNPRSEMRPSMSRVLQILNQEGDEMVVVPMVKPRVSFSASLPLSAKELLFCSDDEGSSSSCKSYDSDFEIHIEG
ncbi:probable L-type lectin-domain containing receptor kinase S.7 [Rutidosis leptorrhynchoides]|uniref:probable L-type lectin-domain containing receptor kinase S.7 n=1 Tax=Rutidosis leptorrhynchoides TaxID=125765 RepID=UPI003A99A4EF